MPHMQPTRVMTLGSLGLGQVYMRPMRRNQFSGLGTVYAVQKRRPNSIASTMTSGLGRTGRMLMGLGQAAGELLDPWAADSAGTQAIDAGIADGALSRETGQAVANPNAVVETPWMSQTLDFDLPGTRFDNPSKGYVTMAASVSLISGLLSGYHGYKRDRGSWGSAIGWFVLGSAFPVITPAVAFLAKPGFAKPRGGKRR